MFTIPEDKRLNSSDLKSASNYLGETETQHISCVNWPESFSYKPQVNFWMAHNGEELFIRFKVKEDCTMAHIQEDNGEVWTDSCVEFFIALDDSGYYNFELTCIGKALLGFRKERPHATHATPEIMATIKRLASLGSENFEETKLDTPWELVVAIPATALFKHQVKTWKDLQAHINVYKCGDNLSKPHYLSWQPINTPEPNFHVPGCFAAVRF